MLQQYDSRNDRLQVSINGKLHPREEAKISVFDSAVQGGDAVWEGLRLYKGKVFALEEHLDRLIDSAHALAFENVPGRSAIIESIRQTLEANGMRDETHIRLTLSRGEKYTSGMDPRLNLKGCTLIVLAEWKPPVYGTEGIKLISTAIRRNSPQFLDSKIHHNNLLNNILAKIEANVAGADDGLMLDDRGFVAETNACNIFMIKENRVYTPSDVACLPGITRSKVIDLCRENSIDCVESSLSLSQFYSADYVFVTGTMGELVSVDEIDGRMIRSESGLELFSGLQMAYRKLTQEQGFSIFKS